MLRVRISAASRPLYHPGMLIVKLRRSAAPVIATASTKRIVASDALGLAALSVVERAGRIKRVVPLSAPGIERSFPPPGIRRVSGLRALVEEGRASDHNADVHLLELENDTDVPDVQTALGNDPHVEFVSPVPVRYLALPTR